MPLVKALLGGKDGDEALDANTRAVEDFDVRPAAGARAGDDFGQAVAVSMSPAATIDAAAEGLIVGEEADAATRCRRR